MRYAPEEKPYIYSRPYIYDNALFDWCFTIPRFYHYSVRGDIKFCCPSTIQLRVVHPRAHRILYTLYAAKPMHADRSKSRLMRRCLGKSLVRVVPKKKNCRHIVRIFPKKFANTVVLETQSPVVAVNRLWVEIEHIRMKHSRRVRWILGLASRYGNTDLKIAV